MTMVGYFALIVILFCCIGIHEVSSKPEARLTADDIAAHIYRGGKARLIWSAKDGKSFPHNSKSQDLFSKKTKEITNKAHAVNYTLTWSTNNRKNFPHNSKNQDLFSKKTKEITSKAYTVDYSSISYEVDCGVSQFGDKIVGGENATHGEFPWQISLQVSGTHMCGASIINSEWIISAAHCSGALNPATTYAVAGEHDLSQNDGTEQYATILEVYQNDFNASTYYNDFLLLKVSPIQLDGQYVAPICLPDPNITFTSGNATVTGWGDLAEGGPSSTILNKVTVPIVDHDLCKEAYPTLGDCQLCAGEEGKDSCQGDSGGPLICLLDDDHWYLCGVVSYGEGCAQAGYPGVYELVPCHTNYVIETTGLE